MGSLLSGATSGQRRRSVAYRAAVVCLLALAAPAVGQGAVAGLPGEAGQAIATPHASVHITLAASTPRIVFGRHVVLSGTVSTGRAGEVVTILARSFGKGAFTRVGVARTRSGGEWKFAVRPLIRADYQARWKAAKSRPLRVVVQPRIDFQMLAAGHFVIRVVAARSFAGRFVLFQRHAPEGRWVNARKVVLAAASAARFAAPLPAGTSVLRVFMSGDQAGPGYVAAVSRTIVFRDTVKARRSSPDVLTQIPHPEREV